MLFLLSQISAAGKITILSSFWLGMTALIGVLDPIEAGARGERLTIIGILIAGLVILGAGIVQLYRAQTTNASYWKAHHEDTVKIFNSERDARNLDRKEEYNAMLQVLRDNSAALSSCAAATRAVESGTKAMEIAIKSLEIAITKK